MLHAWRYILSTSANPVEAASLWEWESFIIFVHLIVWGNECSRGGLMGRLSVFLINSRMEIVTISFGVLIGILSYQCLRVLAIAIVKTYKEKKRK